ncbi:hypothetical protein PMAYCL1PPCAC_19776, partial [Pristionchus mayeri]
LQQKKQLNYPNPINSSLPLALSPPPPPLIFHSVPRHGRFSTMGCKASKKKEPAPVGTGATTPENMKSTKVEENDKNSLKNSSNSSKRRPDSKDAIEKTQNVSTAKQQS